jgi:hypothetical protein
MHRLVLAAIAIAACGGSPSPKRAEVVPVAQVRSTPPPIGERWLTEDEVDDLEIVTVAPPRSDDVRILDAEIALDESRVTRPRAPRSGVVRSMAAAVDARVDAGAKLAEIAVDEVAGNPPALARARADLGAADHEMRRATELYRVHALSTRDFEEARARYDAAIRAFVATRKQLRVRTSVVVVPSPVRGSVLGLSIMVGDAEIGDDDSQGRGSEIAAIGDLDRVLITASPSDTKGIVRGARASFRMQSAPNKIWVLAIDLADDEPRVRGSVNNQDLALRPGAVGKLAVEIPRAPGLEIPRAALVGGDEPRVLVKRGAAPNGRVRFVETSVTILGDGMSVLFVRVDGLSNGDEIVADAARVGGAP